MDPSAIATLAARRSRVLVHSLPRLGHPASRPLLLVATADDSLRELVTSAAALLGCTPSFVRSGAEAISSARSLPILLSIVDQSLSDLTGLEVARALKGAAPRTAFVLVGNGLATSITVEAMKLGATTVLDKPITLNEIVGTIRAAMVESRESRGEVPHTVFAPAAVRVEPRSSAERWASYVLKGCEADGDLRTLGAWASFAGLSYSSLCESCRLVAVQPLDARDFTRLLSAVTRSRLRGCRVEELLDVRDRRTLDALMARAGIGRTGLQHPEVSVEQFLASQRFILPTNGGLAVLRTILRNSVAAGAWPPAARLAAAPRRRLDRRPLPDVPGRA